MVPSLQTPRRSLRDAVRQDIAERIAHGAFSPGQRLNLASLSRALGVSPTPVREALTQLERDGLVRAEPNRGFLVPGPSVRQLEEIYPLLAVLEGLAVRSAPEHPSQLIDALRRANARLEGAPSDPLRAFEADLEWHAQLLTPCTNETLLDELTRLRRRIATTELTFMREAGNPPESVADHERIAWLLEKGRRADAARALQEHWHRSLLFIRSSEEHHR
jgi:DNA-binding GntR family transcriptional regulator